MNGVQEQGQELALLIRPTSEDSSVDQSRQSQINIPRQTLLHSVVRDRPGLTPLKELTPQFISGLYGYCLGMGMAAIGDQGRVSTTAAGVIMSVIAGAHLGTVLNDALTPGSRIGKLGLASHFAIFGLYATSAYIANWNNFCKI